MTPEIDDTAVESDLFRDEDGAVRPNFVAAVEAAVAANDSERTHELVGALHEADLGALLELLDHETRPRLIGLMGPDFDFAALTEVGETTREDILEELPVATLAEGVRELESDDAVAILEALEPEEQAEVLEALPAHERVVLRRSLNYPEDSAGRLMQSTLIAVPAFWTAGQVLDFFRDTDPELLPDNFFEVFVVDPGYRLLGTIFLDALVRARANRRVDEIMQADRRYVHETESSEEVARLFERYNLVSVPVVDDADRLVGVITIDDVVDVLQEAASEEIKLLGGVNPQEELSDDFWETARSRFWWLLVNLFTAFVASSVLKLFENQLERMVALAVLAPIVASQGGNSATQTMTVAVRALATRELSRANAMRVILRELAAAAVNGAVFGLITGVLAGYWFSTLGILPVMGLAMFTNLVAGALGGVLVPLALERWKVDPAVSSSAFVTTVTDVVGYGSFLSIATLWFHLF
ncbi:MAG TPA: magnesium transporter [Methylocystis sp.]|nr:magnesium transporter [Methylocystis sp.]